VRYGRSTREASDVTILSVSVRIQFIMIYPEMPSDVDIDAESCTVGGVVPTCVVHFNLQNNGLRDW
jgi:hypothetical protein